jgi:hypothetical protein
LIDLTSIKSIRKTNVGILNIKPQTPKKCSENDCFLITREKIYDFKYENLKDKEVLGGGNGEMPLMTFEYVLKYKGLNISKDTFSEDVNVRNL